MKVFSAASVRAMEARAVAEGIPEYQLMRRAGEGAALQILFHFPAASRFVILCGSGNNGGDALVVAAELAAAGKKVLIYGTKELSQLHGCAALAARDLPETIPFSLRETLQSSDFRTGDVIVEGVLGTGFSGTSLRPAAASFFRAANESHCPVVALDIPGGINADTGEVSRDGAIRAELTVTFGVPKKGLFCGEGARRRGRFRLVPIGFPEAFFRDFSAENFPEIFTGQDAVALLPRPAADCHKNSRGRVLVFAGSAHYPGAAALAVRGALRGGAGFVRLFSSASSVAPLPLAAVRSSQGETATALLASCDAVAAGPGWGKEGSEALLQTVLSFPGTAVLDADALNLLSRRPDLWSPGENRILTPHLGEAERLAAGFGVSGAGSRENFAAALAGRMGCVVLLKGRDTVVAAPQGKVFLVPAGSAALATAGSGDTLSGLIAALAAQGADPLTAALLGAFLHGIAGENALGTLIADDLAVEIGKTIRACRANAIL